MISDKPRIAYSEMRWFQAFEKLIALGVGKRVEANGERYWISHWNPDPECAWMRFLTKTGVRVVRRGDALMLELKAAK